MKKYLLIAIFLLPLSIHAATATLFVDTGFDAINTLEATLTLPKEIIVNEINTGGSMVLIWVKDPVTDPNMHSITFTGLTPGGFTGKQAVFSFSGSFSKEDLKKFTITGVTALKNDGKGTPAKVALTLSMSIATDDSLSPVAFTPVVGASDDFSSGRAFVSFLTQDKGSGIDHYEYTTKLFGAPKPDDWSERTSPVLLTRFESFKTIYIKAVDREGNVEVAAIPGPNRYAGIFVIVILCIILVVCAPSFRKRFLFS